MSEALGINKDYCASDIYSFTRTSERGLAFSLVIYVVVDTLGCVRCFSIHMLHL